MTGRLRSERGMTTIQVAILFPAVLLFGFLVFIAYPAIAQITSVSGPQP